jgi:hypothetical protein
MELLLCCAQPAAASRPRLLELLDAPIDWVEGIRLGLLHGALPTLHQRLVAQSLPGVPPATLAALGHYARLSAQRNRALTAELLEVLELLKSKRIDAVPFKGPALAAMLYRDRESRQFGDLDILVRRSDVAAAEEALRTRGYRPWKELTAKEERRCLANGKDRPFVSRDGAFAVEIHWRFTPSHYPFALDVADLWNRLESRPFEGSTVLSIPAGDLLLILCVHGTRHQWSSLKWVRDIAGLLAVAGEIDWTRILARARRMGAERMLLTGLLLARDLLHAVLPDEVNARLEHDPGARRLAAQAWDAIVAKGSEGEGGFARPSYQIVSRERLRDRLRILFHLARSKMQPSRRDRLALPLIAPFRFPARLLPPVRLVNRSGLYNVLRFVSQAIAGSASAPAGSALAPAPRASTSPPGAPQLDRPDAIPIVAPVRSHGRA